MPKYIKKRGLDYPKLGLHLDGNPYVGSSSDELMLRELFDLVNGNRNSFFHLLNKKEYSHLADWANSKLPPALTEQTGFVPNWGTKCFWLFNGMTDFPKCPVCGNTYGNDKNVSVGTGYNGHCSNRCKTLDPDVQRKMSDTCMDRFGCDWSSKSEAARKSYIDTCQERYGVDNTFQLESSKEKAKRTNIELHGDENYRNSEQRVETCTRLYGQGVNGKAIGEALKALPSDKKAEWTRNVKRSKLEKHGDENYNNPGKRRETCLDTYGVPYASQSEGSKARAKETFLENYGYDHDWKVPEIREGMRKRHLEKYGVEYPSQREDVKDRTRKSKLRKFGTTCSPSWNYMYDGLSFDSSWELAFYIWLKDSGEDFAYPCDVRFEYSDSYGCHHVYNPDFRVGDKVIEIKGGQFLDKEGKLVLPYRGKKTDEEYAMLCAMNDAKYGCMIEHGVIVYGKADVRQYLDYVSEKYGKDYMRQFGKPMRRKGKKRRSGDAV